MIGKIDKKGKIEMSVTHIEKRGFFFKLAIFTTL